MSHLFRGIESLLAALVVSAALAEPSIRITSVPAYATSGVLQGLVTGVGNHADYQVATYIHVEGVGWWTKPTFASPTVPINSDGTYSVSVVTGGVDDRATIFATMLVPAGYTPPAAGGSGSLPTIAAALASASMFRPSRTISFGSYNWSVKESPVGVGPGGNHFSNLPRDVWVDQAGQLHLTVSNHDGRWWATEVIAQGTFGYGKYVFQTNSRVDQLDPTVTFGAFTWDTFGGGSAGGPNRELDVEDGRWGNASATTTSQFVVQPYAAPGNLVRYALPDLGGNPALTRIIDWQPNTVRFLALRGHHLPGQYSAGDVIFEWTHTGAAPTPGRAVPRLNLWPTNVELGGAGPPAPSSGLPQEVIVSRFLYLSRAAGNTRDFNADGKSDVLLRHTNGTNYIWQLDGASIANSTLAIATQGHLPGLDAGWSIAGTGDFNGDGKSDVLLRHADGTHYVWHLDGANVQSASIGFVSQGYLPGLDNSWSVAGVGDFNGDGKSDVLLRHTNGTVYIWHLDGANIVNGSLAIVSQGYLPSLDSSWTIAGVADFNGDGKSDILLRKSDGTNYVWHTDGASIVNGMVAIPTHGYLPGLDPSWSIAGVGDFNGDGKADALLRHANGTNYVWQLDGASIVNGYVSVTSQGYLPGLDGSWSIAAVGDFNGDGKSDVLLRHSNNTVYVWHIDGANIANQTLGIPSQGYLPSLGPVWSIIRK